MHCIARRYPIKSSSGVLEIAYYNKGSFCSCGLRGDADRHLVGAAFRSIEGGFRIQTSSGFNLRCMPFFGLTAATP